MNTRAERRLSRTRAESIAPARPGWLPLLLELTLELPVSIARAAMRFLNRGWSESRRDGIGVPAMSDDWLREHSADSGKRDEHS